MDDPRSPPTVPGYTDPKCRYPPGGRPAPDRMVARSHSTGRYDSDRSLDDRAARAGDGDSVSEFYRGRDRAGSRVYDRPEPVRRAPSTRSQSMGRLEGERFMEERYGPRYFDEPGFMVERYPRDMYDDRYMRDYYDDRFHREYPVDRFARPPFDERFAPHDRFVPERPGFRDDRFGYDRYPPYDRAAPVAPVPPPAPVPAPMPASERIPESHFDRFGAAERFGNERHHRERYSDRYPDQRPVSDRYGDRHAERFDRHTSYEKYGNGRPQEKYAVDRRANRERSNEKQLADRDRFNASERTPVERSPSDKPVNDRYRTEPVSAERNADRRTDRSTVRNVEQTSSDREQEKFSNERTPSDRASTDKYPAAERFQKF